MDHHSFFCRLQTISYGFVLHKDAFCRSGFNLLDLLVVTVALVSYVIPCAAPPAPSATSAVARSYSSSNPNPNPLSAAIRRDSLRMSCTIAFFFSCTQPRVEVAPDVGHLDH